MPGNHMTPSLAESCTVSPDQRAYEFKLREGPKLHNGDPFTAEAGKVAALHVQLREDIVTRRRAAPYGGLHLLHQKPHPLPARFPGLAHHPIAVIDPGRAGPRRPAGGVVMIRLGGAGP